MRAKMEETNIAGQMGTILRYLMPVTKILLCLSLFPFPLGVGFYFLTRREEGKTTRYGMTF